MFTLKRQRLVKVLLVGLLAGSILAASAPAASAAGHSQHQAKADLGSAVPASWFDVIG